MTTATQEMILSYHPRGAARDIFSMRDPELVVSGPAGTGKSRAILEKLHLVALKYPTCRLLMLRKTRRSLTESGMVTYWQKIRPDLDRVQWKPSLQQYQYPNGSILAVGGLDKPSKIMSSEWDVIYIQECTELSETDWEACTIRLRNGRMPYQQLIGDCNPDAPTHWLRQRANSGKTRMIESLHEDNPLLFDEQGQITTEGQRYLSTLEALSGVRLARYRYGVWAAAEGTVYADSWSRALNIIDRDKFPLKREHPRYLSIDFGYSNPFVCQWWALDPDGRLYRYREIYKTKTLVEDHCHAIAIASGWFHLLPKSHPRHKDRPAEWADPLPREIICDHDAEDRATFERHMGLYTIPAKKSVKDGIQAVASRLRPAGDGKPRLYFLRDSLVERDQDLADRKKPTCTEEEFDTYVFKQDSSGAKEEPVKQDDHGNDCARYMVAHADLQPNSVTYHPDIWR
jgi:phage terminase large subunit